MEVGKHYTVKVVKIVKVGAVVEICPGKTELIHLSKLSNEFVKDINNYVRVGQVLDAECVQGFDKLELSLKHLNLKGSTANPAHTETVQNTHQHSRRAVDDLMYKDEDHDYSGPKFHSKPRKHKSQPSLDDMIAASSQVCQDKMRRMNKRNRDRQYKNRKSY